MAIKRHLQHQRTSSVQYVKVLKKDIPVGASVYTGYASAPTMADLESIAEPYKYIQVSGNGWYYELQGKSATADNLYYGELAISFKKGAEKITIKNSANELVSFEPVQEDKTSVKGLNLHNPAMDPEDGTYGMVCNWKIGYEALTNVNINPQTAVVNVRELSTGKQLIPDVTFNDSNSTLVITLSSDVAIAAKKYIAIIMGTSYTMA